MSKSHTVASAEEGVLGQDSLLQVLLRAQSRWIADSDLRRAIHEILRGVLSVSGYECASVCSVADSAPSGRPFNLLGAMYTAREGEIRPLEEQASVELLLLSNCRTLVEQVMKTRRPAVVDLPDLGSTGEGKTCDFPPLQAFLGLPFFHSGELVGIVVLGSCEGEYSEWAATQFEPVLEVCATLVHATRKERRRKEAETESIAEIINGLPGLFYMFREDGEVLRWNKNFEAVTGYSGAEIAAMHPLDFFEEPERAVVGQRIQEVFTNGAAEVAAHLLLKSGQRIPYLFTSFLISFEGRPCLIGTAVDTSRLNQLEEQLRQSQKMEAVGQLAGGIAHDFNNILTVILGHTDFLLADPTLPADHVESAQEITAAAQRAAGLTRQLLTFSRRQVMTFTEVDLNAVVSDTIRMLRRLLSEAIELNSILGESLPIIRADSSMIEQILLNLAVNARDAMPRGGRLIVRTEEVEVGAADRRVNAEAQIGRAICLTVSDNGTGIAPEHLPRIFEPFFTTKDVGQGTGLGLATIYGIVQQHKGWIRVESHVGEGTTFQIFFPAAAAKPQSRPAPVPQQARTSGGGETILLVEDEVPLRRVVKLVLCNLGYRVLEASSGVEALEVWNAHETECDLLLTDLVMPHGVSGHDLAKQLRARRPQLKVIYTSGYSKGVLGDGEGAGEDVLFLQKPYPPDELARLVRRCLDR